MKIAYIVPSLIRSGPIKVVHMLIEELKNNHEVEVYYFKDITDRELLHFDVLTYKINFTKKINFDKYDIIHSHTIVPDAYIWWHSKDIKKAKKISTLHNYAYEDLPYSYGFLKGYAMANAWNFLMTRHDVLVTLSKNALAYYQKRWLNKSLTYIYNGVDVDKSYKNIKLEHTKTIKIGSIASAGGINRRKGIDQIIAALSLLQNNYELYIAGKKNSESEKLILLAKELGVENRVHFMDYVTDMKAFISEMDIFVVASRSEGFGLSLVEVVSYNKAVVCSDIPIFKEIFDETEVSFFHLEDINSLAEAVLSCYKKRHEFALKAYERFIGNYTLDKMAESYLKVYKNSLFGNKNVR
jgi:glycosyltransferase involved in cell wall biosynthesis